MTSEEYKVPDKLVGLVIGRGGDQLHRLQADTQCKVQIASGIKKRNSIFFLMLKISKNRLIKKI